MEDHKKTCTRCGGNAEIGVTLQLETRAENSTGKVGYHFCQACIERKVFNVDEDEQEISSSEEDWDDKKHRERRRDTESFLLAKTQWRYALITIT